MDHFVRLDRLPDDLEFPSAVQEKIRYDSERRAIVFRGPMSKREYDLLRSVHTDSAYCRAIEELFRVATWDAEEKGDKRLGKAAIIGVAAFLIVALVVLCVFCL